MNVEDKFSTFIIYLSRNIFLNLSGISQNKNDLEEIISELKINVIDNTISEKLSKKIKT